MTIRITTFALALLLSAVPGHACSVIGGVEEPASLVRRADVIARATAVEYQRVPADPDTWTTGVPDSLVRFRVEEMVKGEPAPESVVLPGYLRERDDWNDHPPPYEFVRPNGRQGSCFANSYREGGQFLLFLEARDDGQLGLLRSALAPVNEQLRDDRDGWLVWVRELVAAEVTE